MLHQEVRHPRVCWQVPEQLGKRLEAACRGPDPDNRNRSSGGEGAHPGFQAVGNEIWLMGIPPDKVASPEAPE